MKNIEQSVKFPAGALVSSKIPDAVYELLAKKDVEGARELMPDQLKGELEAIGASIPTDVLDVYMSTATLLFDAYMVSSKVPEAPLARFVHQKKTMDLAEALDKEDFEIPGDALAFMRKTMLDEDLWNSISISVWVNKDGKRQFLKLSSKAAGYFGKVLTAASEALYTEDMKK